MGPAPYTFYNHYCKNLPFNNHKLNLSSLDDSGLSKFNFTPLPDKIKYLRDINLKNNLKWVADKANMDKLGPIGDMSCFDYSDESFLAIYDYTQNLNKLKSIFNEFNSINSYAIAFLVRNPRTNAKVSLDRHFLVNKSTDVEPIIQKVYERIDALSAKYGFEIGDVISVKVRALHFKVNDPKFVGGKIKNTFNLPTDNIKNKNINYRLLSSDYIPHTMNLEFYGTLVLQRDNTYWFNYGNVVIKVEVISQDSHHILEIFNKNFKPIVKIEDNSHDNTFIRQFMLEKQDLFVQYDYDHNLLNLEYNPKVSFMSKTDKDLIHEKKILTFDIETYEKDNIFIPYACAFYDGKKTFTYYLSDFNNKESMIIKCINDMLSPKYHNYTVYCHNFAKFDYILINKILHSNFNVKRITSKDLNIISLNLKKLNKVGKITPSLSFKDSFCMLPSSLNKLGKAFNVETTKDVFPYTFVKENNLNYVGEVPNISYYNSNVVTNEMYLDIKNNTKVWSMRNETILYLEKDIICLFQVVNEMSDIIFKKYRINITKHNTISSLAISIYRSNFLQSHYKLTHTSGDLENAVRSAYFGGRTEVFVPKGENLVSYDFNSLYPTAMLQPMPVGQPTFSLNKDLSKIFGFVKATITTPSIHIPVLPCRVKINGEDKLIFPIGSWTGWYFSEELKLAERFGYKIDVQESYIFEKSYDYFNGYVKEMAFVKSNSTGAMREIHKLLLNTLYGRMGMNSSPDCTEIVSSDRAQEIHLTNNVIDNFRLDENKEYIRYHRVPDQDLCDQSNIDFEKLLMSNDNVKCEVNTSVPIAAATASWARILMYPYIVNSIYTDTDSVFISKPLNENLVGKDLGMFKAEHGLIINAIFPNPKLYFLEKSDGSIVSKRKGFSGKLSKSDYLELYNGGVLDVIDNRWKRNLEIGTITITEHKMRVYSNFSKRRKMYSLGKWVNTTPLCVNSSLQCMTTDITIYNVSPYNHYYSQK